VKRTSASRGVPSTRAAVRWVATVATTAVVALELAAARPAASASPQVLRVGTWHGVAGQYQDIQSAVDAALPGDWILIGPGDYHPDGSTSPEPAGIVVTTPDLHIRGMNRNTVIVDGTTPDAPTACDPGKAYQSPGPRVAGAAPGWNGIDVYKASGVYVENLTVCNFLTSPDGEEGNQIWWNGGDGSGQIGMTTYWGNYLSATSSYSNGFDNPRGEYGLFVSNASGPGSINSSYASNMGDAAFYVGACPDCNAVLDHDHGQNSALGYSGTNSGGNLIVQNTEFDHNKTGLTSNSQNNDDAPSPQIGLCPDGGPGPIGNGSCTIYEHNYIHDNNNPNVPGAGSGLAGAAPIGTGVVLAGARYSTLYANRIEHNGAWGVLVADLPDQGENNFSHCQGGYYVPPPVDLCYYEAFGNEVSSNHLEGNGSFGNPTNGDLALDAIPHDPGNCFHGNVDPQGITSDPRFIQSPPYSVCGAPNGSSDPVLTAEALCATQLLAPCPSLPHAHYPRPTQVRLPKLAPQTPMPDPCAGVPQNPWCP